MNSPREPDLLLLPSASTDTVVVPGDVHAGRWIAFVAVKEWALCRQFMPVSWKRPTGWCSTKRAFPISVTLPTSERWRGHVLILPRIFLWWLRVQEDLVSVKPIVEAQQGPRMDRAGKRDVRAPVDAQRGSLARLDGSFGIAASLGDSWLC